MSKEFYDSHMNFAGRTLSEYYISPGIHTKFNTIMERLDHLEFYRALDVGCSGNSILAFMDNVKHRHYLDLAQLPLSQYWHFDGQVSPLNHPVCGSITSVPFVDENFDIIFALDVLEHIEDDNLAAKELTRVLRSPGYLVVTVPHRKCYFTEQDTICGHVRRYEYEELKDLFLPLGLEEVTKFPVYGQIMKIQAVQEQDPQGTEEALMRLRNRYATELGFKCAWDVVVKFMAKVMEWDAKLQPFEKIMDLCVVFKKK